MEAEQALRDAKDALTASKKREDRAQRIAMTLGVFGVCLLILFAVAFRLSYLAFTVNDPAPPLAATDTTVVSVVTPPPTTSTTIAAAPVTIPPTPPVTAPAASPTPTTAAPVAAPAIPPVIVRGVATCANPKPDKVTMVNNFVGPMSNDEIKRLVCGG